MSTRETYSSGLLNFHDFCDSKNVPKSQRTPADPSLISTFLSALAGLYLGSTIANDLHGIRAWYVIHSIPWSLVDDEINVLLKATTSLAPPCSK
ncbi:hypothetical protein PAXINDRAFT_71142, partial [Paxillus involutus ATCC 200175]